MPREDEPAGGRWIHPQEPSPARMWNYWSGGQHHTPADRRQAKVIEDRCLPGVRRMAMHNRLFLRRATEWAALQGVTQHLDLGCGLPVNPMVHEMAGASRTAYVDLDPEAAELTGAALGGDPGLIAVQGDIRDPGAALDAAAGVIDPGEPVCLLFGMVLHFCSADEARDTVAAWAALAAPGSAVAISCMRVDSPALWQRLAMTAPGGLRNFTRGEFRALFGSLDLVPPGISPAAYWRGGWREVRYEPPEAAYTACGMGIKRAEEGEDGR